MRQILGLACIVGTSAFKWPQAWKARLPGLTQGVSRRGSIYGLVAALLWIGYGIDRGDSAVVTANISVAVASILVVVALRRDGALVLGALATAVVGAASLVAGLSLVSGLGLGLVAIALTISGMAAQTWVVLRRGASVDGVSTATFALLTAVALLWIGYGMLRGDPLVVLPNLVMAPCAATVAWRSRRPADHLGAPVTTASADSPRLSRGPRKATVRTPTIDARAAVRPAAGAAR